MTSRQSLSLGVFGGVAVSCALAGLAFVVTTAGSAVQPPPVHENSPPASKDQPPRPEEKAKREPRASQPSPATPGPGIHIPPSLQHDSGMLPIGIRLQQNQVQLRDRATQTHTEAKVITEKAREMATATSGLVAPANRNEAMIHTFLSTVNAGLNALDKDTLSFTRFRSSPENVGDYVRRQAEKPGSIYSLKTYQDNAVKLINDPDASTSYRIVGGEIDLSGTYSAVAAIGYSIGGVTDYSCTGTLIGKNVVLTAGHCYNNCNEFIGGQIFIGLTTSGPGTVIKVKKAIQHPDFKRDPAPGEPRNDLTVLVLERDVTAAEATPIPLAPVNTLASHPSGTLAVGYGNTNASGSSGYGVRRFATIPIAD